MIDKPYINGSVQAVFFQNPANFYKVMLIAVEETNSRYEEPEIVVTGSFGDILEGETYQFFGDIVDHPRYGRQFQATTYKKVKPTTENGLVEYLSGEAFPGIGKKTAEKIVDMLGSDAIEVIMNDPSRLSEIPGLTKKRQQTLQEGIRENYGMEQMIVSLHEYGFGSQLAMTIYQLYKGETLELIEEDPYRLIEDIEGVGFKRADALAERLGIAADAPVRLRAAIQFELLQNSMSEGNTYMEAEDLLREVIETLESSRSVEISPQMVADQIIQLTEENKIQQEETKIFDNSLCFAEMGIGTSIKRLLSRKKRIHYDDEKITELINLLEESNGMSYGPSQVEAMKEAICSPLFILTGGPGTGKTTVVNGIVSLFAALNDLSLDINDYHDEVFPILLAAPTGRAAKRMNETTGLPASTIHRMLGLTGLEKNSMEEVQELEGGILIVDEMSMVDTWLANTLLKSIPTNMQVIFVGDKDQLPSVGPGQVLHDLLQVNEIPSRELTEIYRQGNDSSIIPLAHSIKNGLLPRDFHENQSDRSFFSCNAYQVEGLIEQIVKKAQIKGFTAQDIQILAPMYRGVAGIDNLNKMMQEVFNPNETGTRKEVKWNDKVYRIGDKVLQLVNEPELNVFNGDMGAITGIIYAKDNEDKVDKLVISFDQTEVTYQRSEWNKITLSYCCSIHKSQGSEFKMVIMPMVQQYFRMLQRNLLYTGITRSQEKLILLGELGAFKRAVENEGTNRKTYLLKRISEAIGVVEGSLLSVTYDNEPLQKAEAAKPEFLIGEEDVLADSEEKVSESWILTLDKIEQRMISPMVGMDETLTPYDFQT
ncbi:exodeoxyribonuclease V subunit alpha [Vagococcus elongatus]|uniref:ATP-dependent RecD2 DNA helicase n=2 Tax=Vagococcus elongatus TaxID=180344 RepID=A0A430B251_9ENTE|nr:exodeoxyribonuclease V subunit alpha [Vagococcus elongatus]